MKISGFVYMSIFDWSLDVFELLNEMKEIYSENKINLNRILEVELWLEEKLTKISITEEEKIYKLIQKLIKILDDMNMIYYYAFNPKNEIENQLNKSKNILKNPTKKEIDLLQSQINIIQDKKILKNLIIILHKHIPSLELNEYVSIDISQITMDCFNEIKNLLITTN